MPTTVPSDRPAGRSSVDPAAPARAHVPLPCPDCRRPLPGPVVACPACDLPLRGPVAARLWEVDQRRAALDAERADLVRRLRASAGGPAGPRLPAPRRSPDQPPGRAAQRLLLTLGAGLLLVAAVVFLAVSWSLLGIGGRVTAMAVLTAACFVVAARLDRHGLPSAANSVAALGVGLAAADLAAARALGLAGLDAVDPRTWTFIAGAGLAALLLAVRPVLPRLGAVAAGGVLATAVAGAAGLLLDEAAQVEGSLWPWSALALAAVLAGEARALRGYPTARVVAAGLAAVAATASGAAAVGLLAYAEGPSAAVTPTLVAAGAAAALAAATTWLWRRTAGTHGARWGAAAGLAGGAVAAATAVVLTERAGGVALTALAVAAAAAAGAAASPGMPRPLPPVMLAGAVPTAVLAVAVLPGHPDLPVTSAVALAAAALAAGAWALLRPDTAPGTEPLAAALAVAAVTGAAHERVDVLAVSLLVAALAVAGAAAARRGRAAEPGLGAVAAVAGLAGVAAAAGDDDARLAAAVLASLGLAAFAYALLPRRGWVSPAGVAGSSAATWVLLADARVDVLEAYTLPLAGLLLLVGLERLRRDPAAPSWATVGPAVSAALLPSAALAADEGTWPRAGIVLVAAAAVLLAGVALRWQAPVVIGALALVVTGVAQLAPLAVGLPRWLTLGAVGAVLLLAGVRYEARRAELERARAWVSSLG